MKKDKRKIGLQHIESQINYLRKDSGDNSYPFLRVVVASQAYVDLMRSQLANILRNFLSRGWMVSDQGHDREFDPSTDVSVYPDTNDSTLYHFVYKKGEPFVGKKDFQEK